MKIVSLYLDSRILGTATPYVCVGYGNQKHKTASVKKSLSPQWDGETASLYPSPLSLSATLCNDSDAFQLID